MLDAVVVNQTEVQVCLAAASGLLKSEDADRVTKPIYSFNSRTNRRRRKSTLVGGPSHI